MRWRAIGNDVGKDRDARALNEAFDPERGLGHHCIGGEKGVLGAEVREGAMRVVEMVHRASELGGPGKQVLEEASKRLSIIEPHPLAVAHALQLGDCARALRWGNRSDTKGSIKAEARPQDRRARLSLGRNGHSKSGHHGDLAPAAEQADEAGEADALKDGVIRVDEARV